MSLDELLSEVKDFGLFQAMVIVLVYGAKGLVGWSMMTMAFAGAAPDWRCFSFDSQDEQEQNLTSILGNVVGLSNTTVQGNVTTQKCPVDANQTCMLEFSADKRTIVSEWGLVCGQAWVPNLVTSVQMAGVMAGAMASGQLGDLVGRRWTHFVTLLLHMALNVGAGFSQSWQMFTVFRFLLGMTIGSELVMTVAYTVELTGPRSRVLVPFMSFWTVGVMIFALAAWQLHDWSYLHFAVAALHLPFLLAFFITPESLRWLVVKGRVKEAERCLATMARFNRVPEPTDVRPRLAKLSEEFQRVDRDVGTVTYLDLLRRKDARLPTLVFSFSWFTLSLVFYGLSFSARSLAGNIYLNIFLLSLMEITAFLPTFFLNDKIGRRWTVALMFFVTTAASVCIIVFSLTATEDVASLAIKILALAAKASISACWTAEMIYISELYPTKIRGVAYGWANTAARVGGIVAPFVVNMDSQRGLLTSYAVVGGLTLLGGGTILLLKETLGQEFKDTLNPLEMTVKVEVDKLGTSSDLTKCHIETALESGQSSQGNGAIVKDCAESVNANKV